MGTKLKKYSTRNLTFTSVLLLLLILGLSVNRVSGQAVKFDSVASAKFQFLEQSIKQDHQHTLRWWYGWLGAYSAGTIGQGVVCFTSNDLSLQQDMALGAATTILGVAGQFISPFFFNKEYDGFNNLPENSDEDKLQKLVAAEKLLNRWSERERMALTWQNHILPTAVNLAGGLITCFGFKRSFRDGLEDGLISFAINTVVTEAQIWTQPTLAKRNYKKYCQRYLTGNETYSYVPEVAWYIEALPGGIGIKIKF